MSGKQRSAEGLRECSTETKQLTDKEKLELASAIEVARSDKTGDICYFTFIADNDLVSYSEAAIKRYFEGK